MHKIKKIKNKKFYSKNKQEKINEKTLGMQMNIESKILLKYKDPKDAEIVFKSLEVDNKGFVKGELKENTINFEIKSDNLGTFLNTADDLISSEIVAENIIKNTKE